MSDTLKPRQCDGRQIGRPRNMCDQQNLEEAGKGITPTTPESVVQHLGFRTLGSRYLKERENGFLLL